MKSEVITSNNGDGRVVVHPPNILDEIDSLSVLSLPLSISRINEAMMRQRITPGEAIIVANFLKQGHVRDFGESGPGIDISRMMQEVYQPGIYNEFVGEVKKELDGKVDVVMAAEHSAIAFGSHIATALGVPMIDLKKGRAGNHDYYRIPVESWTDRKIFEFLLRREIFDEISNGTEGRILLADDIVHTTHTSEQIIDFINKFRANLGRQSIPRVNYVVAPYVMAFTGTEQKLHEKGIQKLFAGMLIDDMGFQSPSGEPSEWMVIRGISDKHGQPAVLGFTNHPLSIPAAPIRNVA